METVIRAVEFIHDSLQKGAELGIKMGDHYSHRSVDPKSGYKIYCGIGILQKNEINTLDIAWPDRQHIGKSLSSQQLNQIAEHVKDLYGIGELRLCYGNKRLVKFLEKHSDLDGRISECRVSLSKEHEKPPEKRGIFYKGRIYFSLSVNRKKGKSETSLSVDNSDENLNEEVMKALQRYGFEPKIKEWRDTTNLTLRGYLTHCEIHDLIKLAEKHGYQIGDRVELKYEGELIGLERKNYPTLDEMKNITYPPKTIQFVRLESEQKTKIKTLSPTGRMRDPSRIKPRFISTGHKIVDFEKPKVEFDYWGPASEETGKTRKHWDVKLDLNKPTEDDLELARQIFEITV